MRGRTVQALLMLGLVLLAGCSASGKANLAPPLIFPTAVQGPPGPPPLSVYFSATTTGSSPKSTIMALDASDGSLRWSYAAKAKAQAVLRLDSNVVYFGAADQQVYALDASNGRVRWHVQISGFPAVTGAMDGVVYGSIVANADSQFNGGPIFALKASDGSLKWRSQIAGMILGMVDNILYVGGTSENTLYALNASDGSVRWHFTAVYTPYEINVEQGEVYLFTTTASGTNSVATFYALNVSDGSLKWRYPTNPNDQEDISLVGADDSAVYLTVGKTQSHGEDEALALKGIDGTLLWHYQIGSMYRFFASSMLDSGVIYLGGSDGNLYALHASDGTLLWQKAVGNTYLAVDLVESGIIYTFSQTEGITVVNSTDGAIRWRYQSNEYLLLVAVQNGLLYGVSLNGNFSTGQHNYAFALKITDGTSFWKFDGGTAIFFPIIG